MDLALKHEHHTKIVYVRHCDGVAEPIVSTVHHGAEGRKHCLHWGTPGADGPRTCSGANDEVASVVNGLDVVFVVMRKDVWLLSAPVGRSPHRAVLKARCADTC